MLLQHMALFWAKSFISKVKDICNSKKYHVLDNRPTFKNSAAEIFKLKALEAVLKAIQRIPRNTAVRGDFYAPVDFTYQIFNGKMWFCRFPSHLRHRISLFTGSKNMRKSLPFIVRSTCNDIHVHFM